MRKTFTCILLLFYVLASAQVNDFAFWPGMKFSKNLPNKFSLTLWTQVRITSNATRPMNYFNDLCLSYRINKRLVVEGAYVNVENRNVDNTLSMQHQFYTDLIWKPKVAHSLHFKYMPQFQVMYTDYNSSETGKVPDYFVRNKFGLDYKINKKFHPFCFVESRHYLNKETPGKLNRMRYSMGVNIKISKHNNFDVYYMIQQEKNLINPTTLYIFGINYNLDLDFGDDENHDSWNHL